MLITTEELIPRFAKIRLWALKSLNYNRPYIARQLGVAFPDLTFELTDWHRLGRMRAKVTFQVTKGDQTQMVVFEHACKRVPALTAPRLPLLSMNRSDYAAA